MIQVLPQLMPLGEEVTVPEPEDMTLKEYVPLVPVPVPVPVPVLVPVLELVLVVAVVLVVPVSPPPPQAVIRKMLRMMGRKNTARPAALKVVIFCVSLLIPVHKFAFESD